MLTNGLGLAPINGTGLRSIYRGTVPTQALNPMGKSIARHSGLASGGRPIRISHFASFPGVSMFRCFRRELANWSTAVFKRCRPASCRNHAEAQRLGELRDLGQVAQLVEQRTENPSCGIGDVLEKLAVLLVNKALMENVLVH